MNFVLKGILRRAFQQYLDLQQPLNIDSGAIKLAQGHLNKQKFNKKLKDACSIIKAPSFQIIDSKFHNLHITLPILELMTKPIKVQIKSFDLLIQQEVNQGQSSQQTKMTLGQVVPQQFTESSQQQHKKEDKQSEKQSQPSTLKNLVNRLLFNMQIMIQHVNITLKTHSKKLFNTQFNFFLKNLHIRNSSIQIDGMNVKKTINMRKLQIGCQALGQALIEGFNVCIDYNQKCMQVIALMENLEVLVFNINSILDLAIKIVNPEKNKKKNRRRVSISSQRDVVKPLSPSKQQVLSQFQLKLYFKMNNFIFALEDFIEAQIKVFEIKAQKILRQKSLQVNLKQLILLNNRKQNVEQQNKVLLKVSYQPPNPIFRTSYDYEKNILKNSQLYIQLHEQQTDFNKKLYNVNAALYYISIEVDYNVISNAIKEFFFMNKELVQKVMSLILKFKNPPSKNQKNLSSQMNQNQIMKPRNTQTGIRINKFQILLYRIAISVKMPHHLMFQLIFSTVMNATNKTKMNFAHIMQLGILLHYSKYSKIKKLKVLEIANTRLKYDDLQNKGQLIISGQSLVSEITIQMIPWIKILLKTIGTDIKQIQYFYQEITNRFQELEEKQFGHIDDQQIMQNYIKMPTPAAKKDGLIKIQKALFKMPVIVIKVGSCQQVKIGNEAKKPMSFKHLIELEIQNLSGYYADKKSKLSFQIGLFMFSPHTLQKGAIINELKFQAVLKKNNTILQKSNYDLQLSLKNNLVVNLEEIFLRTIFQYLEYLKCKQDHNSVFLSALNLTQSSMTIKQNTLSFQIDPGHIESIFVEPSKQIYPSATIQTLSKIIDETFLKERSSHQIIDSNEKIKRVNSKRSSFSMQQKGANYNFHISTNKGQSQKITILNPSTQYFIMEQNICFDYQFEDNEIVVRWVPKFGLIFKQRIMIAAFTGNIDSIQIGWKTQIQDNQQQRSLLQDTEDKINLITAENMKDMLDFNKIFTLKKHYVGANTLDELSENYKNFLIKIGKKYYEIDVPSLNDKFTLYPLAKFQPQLQKQQPNQRQQQKTIFNENSSKQVNLYDFYIYEQTNLNSIFLQILPFLIVENHLENKIKLSVQNRKNQKIEHYSFQNNTSRPLLSTQSFDYYMKQFTFVLSVHLPIIKDGVEHLQQFVSQQRYFNTFFMVTDHFETVIELRSLSSPVKKIYYTVSQRIQAKTKILSFCQTLRIVNNSSVSLGIQYHGRVGSGENRGPLWINSRKVINNGGIIIKNYGTLSFLYENKPQTKVDVKCQWLVSNQSVVLSFNFCKQGQKYYHALLGLRLQSILSVQVLIIEDFIECTNYCCHEFQINNNKVPIGNTIPLFLPSTVDHRFNNKSFPIHGPQIQQLFKQLFLSDNNKISGQSLSIKFYQEDEPISFVSLLLQSIYETNNSQKIDQFTVYTLFKDLKTKIIFFITQSLYDSNSFYTFCNNQTNHHFLFTQDYQCGHYLIKDEQQESSSPKSNGSRHNKQQKFLLKPKKFSQFVNKENYDIFHCDSKRSHLRKIDKKLMEDLGIKFQTHYLQQFTVVNIEEANKPLIQVQFITKAITIKFRTKLGKSQTDTNQNLRRVIMLNLNRLTFRLLQHNKMDLLLCDLTISQQSLNQTILKIPQESYLLIELKKLNQKFCMIKNIFLKCKNTIININQKLLATLLNFYKAVSGEIITEISNTTKKPQAKSIDEEIFTLIQQLSKKQLSTSKFMDYLSETIFLMKNMYIHEIHLSLTLNLDNISFSNALTLPPFELSNKPFRMKKIKKQIADFYLGNLLAKFPKLSFCMQGLKHPINMIKTILKVRGTLKDKILISKICDYGSSLGKGQSFRPLSLQALNMYILNSCSEPSHRFPNIIVSSVQFDKKIYLLSLQNFIIMSNQLQIESILALRDLQKLKIIKSKDHSQIMLRFRNTSRNNMSQNNLIINFYTLNKKCERLVNWLNDLIL